jgi:hypothetical protein
MTNDSASAAPSVSHVEQKKHKKAVDADRVEDSKEHDSYNFSSDKELEKLSPQSP